MDLETLLLFVPACFVLNVSPGPNNLLTMNHAVRFGWRHALSGGVGRLFAFVLMIALTAAGLGAVLAASEFAFSLIKYLGATYLFYLGVKLWRAPVSCENPDYATVSSGAARFGAARQNFLLAMGNPKAILVFTAFFPQFMDPGLPTAHQFATLGGAFLVLEMLAVGLYAGVGRQFGALCQSDKATTLVNRLSGGFLVGAGIALVALRQGARMAT